MLTAGQILHNRYRIVRQLGAGGMGAVYEAEDSQRFGKKVALKEISLNLSQKNSEHFRRAFEREAKILTQIDHEAVPKVVGYLFETDYQILVMELIEGEDLDKILEREKKPFLLEDVLDWSEQLLDALDYLHTLNPPIIHRDIKPQNLKLTARGKIKLLDFGIAKDSEAELNQTSHKTMVGATLYYSPIEQIIHIPEYFTMLHTVFPEKAMEIASQKADARSDIYSLGATLYHLLTADFPRPAYLRAVELWSERPDSLAPLQETNAEISPEISNVLQKAMAIDREYRFASAKEMRAALREAVLQEKRRKEREFQSSMRLEREKLEAERLKLIEERQRLEQNQAEAERKRLEEIAYEAKLKEWQSKHSIESQSHAPTELLPEVSPPSENLSTEDTWADLSQMKSFAGTDSPFYAPTETFEPEPPQIAPTTLTNKPQTAPEIPVPEKPKKNPLFWILPVAFAFILLFGIGALGVILLVRNFSGTTENKTTPTVSPTKMPSLSPTISPSPTVEPSISPTVSPTAQPTAQPTNSPIKSISDNEKPKPTVAPTVQKPIVVKPTQTKTPKPQPTRNNDCIFTGKC